MSTLQFTQPGQTVTTPPLAPSFVTQPSITQPPQSIVGMSTMGGALPAAAPAQVTGSTVTAVRAGGKKGLPTWTPEIARALAAKHQYKQIIATTDGFKATTLQVSGAKKRMQDMRNKNIAYVYVPGLRVAGEMNTVQNYLQQLVNAGKANANDVQAAVRNSYNYDNSVASLNQGLEAEIRAKEQAPKPAKAPKSQVTLAQLIALNKALGRGLSKSASGGRPRAAGRQAKSVPERAADAAAFNSSAAPGVGWKYVNFSITKEGKLRAALGKAGDKSFKVLHKTFPMASKDANLLLQKLNEFRQAMGDGNYQQALRELQAQGVRF